MLVHAVTGDEIVETGQAFYMPPGHVPEFLDDCEVIEFAPMAEFNEMKEHVMRQTPGGR